MEEEIEMKTMMLMVMMIEEEEEKKEEQMEIESKRICRKEQCRYSQEELLNIVVIASVKRRGKSYKSMNMKIIQRVYVTVYPCI